MDVNNTLIREQKYKLTVRRVKYNVLVIVYMHIIIMSDYINRRS